MAEGTSEPSAVTLGRMKFSNWQEKDNPAGDKGMQKEDARPAMGFSTTQYPTDFRRPEAYERMAADKPGEEMAPDGTIWKLYLEEAESHDAELVRGHQGSLDMLLLFAALFSAILTAFIIESKDLLQQDYAEASAALLLQIAQSQRRIELGVQPSAADEPINNPSFSPPTSARWINGIWFTSLALSLSAALIAMLGKEWLTAYLQSRPHHAYNHALLRQSRFEGLDKWWALHIIALLPSLLHLSLLLFSAGLVVYLWSLDESIACVVIGITGLTVAFYMITAVLGAIYDYCPYVTQVSGYLRSTYTNTLSKATRSTPYESRPTFTPELDLRALLWLANNARDPAVVDCSYQALAGLRLAASFTKPAPSGPTSDANVISDDVPSAGALIQLDNQTTLGSLFLTVSERFQRHMRAGSEFSTSSWENAVRSAGVLVELAGRVKGSNTGGYLVPEEKETEFGLNWLMGDKDNSVADNQSPEKSGKPSQFTYSLAQSLEAFAHLWHDKLPPLHSDIYAGFIVAELLLLSYAVEREATHPRRVSSSAGRIKSADHHNVNMSWQPNGASTSGQEFFKIQAQYSRALTRAGALIRLHTEGKIVIGTGSLERLLNALCVVADSEPLNSTASLSAHHPQSNLQVTQKPQLILGHNAGSLQVDPLDLDAGLLGDLTRLLRMSIKEREKDGLQIRLAAVRAFSALAPVLSWYERSRVYSMPTRTWARTGYLSSSGGAFWPPQPVWEQLVPGT
ncbi:hypothetical protein FRC07_007553 [Ceratobasidium sp. 392]|nr:hypothetical protein FRC07_007553 [Ceratobasidium sp. 392]